MEVIVAGQVRPTTLELQLWGFFFSYFVLNVLTYWAAVGCPLNQGKAQKAGWPVQAHRPFPHPVDMSHAALFPVTRSSHRHYSVLDHAH